MSMSKYSGLYPSPSTTSNYSVSQMGEVVLSALPARLRIDDTQAYILMDCKRGKPVSALGVGGNGLRKKNNCSPHLEVAFRPCVSGDMHKKAREVCWCLVDTLF